MMDKTRVLAVTSFVCQNKHIFLFDLDDTDLCDVIYEANHLHEMFGIDIYILQSSANGYHLVSFDIIDYKECRTIQAWVDLNNDYLILGEADNFSILRISEKANKHRPKYVMRIVNENNYMMKSLGHYKLYQKLCNMPDAPEWYNGLWFNCDLFLCSYVTQHRLEVDKNDK